MRNIASQPFLTGTSWVAYAIDNCKEEFSWSGIESVFANDWIYQFWTYIQYFNDFCKKFPKFDPFSEYFYPYS